MSEKNKQHNPKDPGHRGGSPKNGEQRSNESFEEQIYKNHTKSQKGSSKDDKKYYGD